MSLAAFMKTLSSKAKKNQNTNNQEKQPNKKQKKKSNEQIEKEEAAQKGHVPVPKINMIARSEMENQRGNELYGPPTQILPWLYLGTVYNAESLEVCKQFSLTHILNVAPECHTQRETDDYLKLIMEDFFEKEDQHQHHIFEQAYVFLDGVRSLHENKGEKSGEGDQNAVLVHCARGRSRSATIIIGYLMHREKMTLHDAYIFVKEKRPIIGPHNHLKKQLITFEKTLAEKNSIDYAAWQQKERSYWDLEAKAYEGKQLFGYGNHAPK